MNKNGAEFIWRFTPSRTEPDLLEDIFVQRETLLKNLVDNVSTSARQKGKHFTLLIGPRGIGKTHLISMLHNRVDGDASLRNHLRICWLLEDETITSFTQLLKRTYEILAEKYPEEFSTQWLESILDNTPDTIRKELTTELESRFANKTLLLLIENLDLLFKNMPKQDQHKWRAFLQETPFTTITASSQRLFNEIRSGEEPFYGFFAPVHLKPLTVDDSLLLLIKIAKRKKQSDLAKFLTTADGRSRVRALHHLAGGNHRIYIVLSSLIDREKLESLVEPFEKMADELTPYYQERMRWISPQQRQIVEFLSASDSPQTPKSISRHLLASENSISRQLKDLLELGYLLRTPRGKESLYELAEPLMKLASEVKEKQRKPLRVLVKFLRIWYRKEQLPLLLEIATSESLKSHLLTAIKENTTCEDPRIAVYVEQIEAAKERGQTQAELSLWDELCEIDKSTKHFINYGTALLLSNHTKKAAATFEKVIEDKSISISHRAIALLGLANACFSMGRPRKALRTITEAINLRISPRVKSICYYSRGMIHAQRKNSELAKTDFSRIMRMKNISTSLRLASQIYRGKVLLFDSHFSQAIDDFNAVISNSSVSKILLDEARFMSGLAHVQMGDAKSGAKLFAQIIKSPSGDQHWLSFAHWGTGIYFESLNQFSEALIHFNYAIQLEPSLAEAHERKCLVLFQMGEWNNGFDELESLLQNSSLDESIEFERIIFSILRLSSHSEQMSLCQQLVDLVTQTGHAIALGGGLVRSLGLVPKDEFSPKKLIKWKQVWQQGSVHEELAIAVRVFSVGIDFLATGDNGLLLNLVRAERQLLSKVLKMEQ